MDYYARIQKSIDFIEENLCENISIDQISGQAYFSVTHFYRIFQSMVGDPIKEYIRKRRLSKAAQELLRTDKRLIDIALEFRFESQEAFTRAFFKLFGINPGKYRKSNVEIRFYEKVNIIDKFCNNNGGITMEPKIIMKNELKVIGYEMITTYEEDRNFNLIPKFWERFMHENLTGKIPNKVNPNARLGISKEINAGTGSLSYLICTEVNSLDNIPEGMVGKVIPSNKYAVFTAKGQPIPEKIAETWAGAFNSWLAESGFELAEGEFFELFDERCNNTDSSEVDVYIPIK